MDPAIVPAADQDQVRLELASDREQKRVTGVPVFVAAELCLLFPILLCGIFLLTFDFLKGRLSYDPSIPCNIYVETSTPLSANVGSLAILAPREESHIVIAVKTHIQHLI